MTDTPLTQYKSEATTDYGLNDKNEIIVGFKLVPIESASFDLVHETLVDIGAEAILIIPPIKKEGMVFTPCVVNERKDYELGIVDDYDIKFIASVASKNISVPSKSPFGRLASERSETDV